MTVYDNLKKLNIEQYKNSDNFNKIIKDFADELEELKIVFEDIQNVLNLETATGYKLDIIGAIVEQPRNGLPDNEYKRQIQFKIFLNTSKAQVADIVYILKFITEADKVVYSPNPPAEYTIYTNGQVIPAHLALFMDNVTAAGVSVIIYASVDGSKPIVFYDNLFQGDINNLIDDNINQFITDQTDDIVVYSNQNILSQIVNAFEDNSLIISESDEFIIVNEEFKSYTFINVKGTYEIFNGVGFGVVSLNNFIDNNGNQFITDTGVELGVHNDSDDIISEGKLVVLVND